MAEIEITLPTVQYGNVKVRATPEELGIDDLSNADQVGIVTAIYLNLFTQGFKLGSQMDVSAPVSASQEAPGPKARTISEVLSDEDVDTVAEAQAILDKELGGVTVVDEGESDEPLAPWERDALAPERKPWETDDVTAPVVLDAAW